MSEDSTRSRDRPINDEAEKVQDNAEYEFNSYWAHRDHDFIDIFGCGITNVFTPKELKDILKDPITHHGLARKLAMYVYNTEGVVTNAIDYMVSLPCLDRVICGKKKMFGKTKTDKNKELMKSALETIGDKQFIRDVLFTDMNEGTSFYYLDTTAKTASKKRFMRDGDVGNIMELCDIGMNAVMVPLPYNYCKIVGRKNGRYVIAFDLKYFDAYEGDRVQKLKRYPKEIYDAYIRWKQDCNSGRSSGSWVVLDNDHTIAHKIKCKVSEPWGRPLAIAAIADIWYQDDFVNTKRNVLNEVNNKIIYQTLPEGRDKGSCALTKSQQQDQHDKVKSAVLQKNNRGGTSFFTVSAGTKINSLDVSTDIFDEKNEADLTDKIAMDMGMAAQLLGASSTGTFANGQHNLEMINAQLYMWIQEIQAELNYVINACIIKDRKNKVEVYYLPTSLVNRKNFFDMMKSLYLEAGGSYTFLIASTGVSPDVYFNVLDEEIDNKIFDKYQPHPTSYTMSNDDSAVGRPVDDTSTNPHTLKSKANNSNNQPKPSTQ